MHVPGQGGRPAIAAELGGRQAVGRKARARGRPPCAARRWREGPPHACRESSRSGKWRRDRAGRRAAPATRAPNRRVCRSGRPASSVSRKAAGSKIGASASCRSRASAVMGVQSVRSKRAGHGAGSRERQHRTPPAPPGSANVQRPAGKRNGHRGSCSPCVPSSAAEHCDHARRKGKARGRGFVQGCRARRRRRGIAPPHGRCRSVPLP